MQAPDAVPGDRVLDVHAEKTALEVEDAPQILLFGGLAIEIGKDRGGLDRDALVAQPGLGENPLAQRVGEGLSPPQRGLDVDFPPIALEPELSANRAEQLVRLDVHHLEDGDAVVWHQHDEVGLLVGGVKERLEPDDHAIVEAVFETRSNTAHRRRDVGLAKGFWDQEGHSVACPVGPLEMADLPTFLRLGAVPLSDSRARSLMRRSAAVPTS